MDEKGRLCFTHTREKKGVQSFGGKFEGKKLLGKHRHRWEDKDYIHLTQNIEQWQTFIETIMKFWDSVNISSLFHRVVSS
jgi:hypothetical protein